MKTVECWLMADSWNCRGPVALPGRGRLWRMCGVGGLVINFGMCCLIRSSKRWDVRATNVPTVTVAHKLSDTEQFVLSHGLSFCLPPTSIKREEVFADFEVLYAQLDHHKPRSKEQLAALKARLSDLPHAYCGSRIDWGDFLITKECFLAIKSLRMNEDIIITKPDKGSGVVILNKNEYNDKMMTILNDTTKFLDLGPAISNDNTAKIEAQIQRRLLQLNKEKLI